MNDAVRLVKVVVLISRQQIQKCSWVVSEEDKYAESSARPWKLTVPGFVVARLSYCAEDTTITIVNSFHETVIQFFVR